MGMTKKLGKALQTGVTGSGIAGLHEQTGNNSAGGELKIYRDKDGNTLSVYAADVHKVYSWTALIEADVPDKEIGDPISLVVGNNTIQACVTQWEVTEQNDEVKRVNIGIRTFPDLAETSPSSNSQTPANGNT